MRRTSLEPARVPTPARARTLGILLALALGTAAAVDNGCSHGERAMGTLKVHVSDAPYPFGVMTAAEITFERVEARLLAEDDSESDFYVLVEEPRTVNVLDLRGGVTELLAESEVPAGLVEQVRLEISAGRVTLADGRGFDLVVPDAEAGGLSLFLHPRARVGAKETAELLLDVDIAETFGAIPAADDAPPGIAGFTFRPTLRVADLAGTGTLSGYVRGDAGTPDDPADDEALPDVDVRLEGAGTFRTATDASGEWRILGLPPGDYVVAACAIGHHDGKLDASAVAAQDDSTANLLLRRE